LLHASPRDFAIWGAGTALLYGFGFWNGARRRSLAIPPFPPHPCQTPPPSPPLVAHALSPPRPLHPLPAAAKRIGITRGHRFGLLLTVPNILAGGLFVAQRGMFRYLGFEDNGNPPLYPNYKVDETPYFVKHSVSDKRR
jgi:hypothetical protein